jgi:Ca-activated chloride channel homolog
MRFRYSEWDDRFHSGKGKSPFDTLRNLFQELLTIAGGDVSQALKWLNQLDDEYQITDQFEDDYGIGDFIDEMKERGYIRFDEEKSVLVPTAKTDRSIRQKSLEEIFSKLRKGGEGGHQTPHTGRGLERQPETRNWKPGDDTSHIDSTGTMLNMLRHSSLDQFDLQENDLEVYNTDHYTSVSTVLLIDLSHSMILYGEDRITPAKKVAMALSELIMNTYAKDSLDIVAFGNEAWQIEVKDLPYLQVGPYHTNTLHGLEMARHILQRKRFSNKQIFMITDGKPSCMFEGGRLYKNSFGLDRKIVNRVLNEAVKCKRDRITITTFMIARDPYLQNFVREMTEANQGRAYYASLNNLGGYIFEDYIRNRRKHVK